MIFATLTGLAYYFIPAYAANALPPLLVKIPLLEKWKTPVDFGKKWHDKPLLGKNKTWRGVIGGTLIGGLIFLLQQHFLPLSSIPYDSMQWYAGFLLAFGAIFLGDCGKSLLKRRFAKRPGASWIPFDQIDFTIGAFLLTYWIFWPGWFLALILMVLNGFCSMLFHLIGYAIGVTKDKI